MKIKIIALYKTESEWLKEGLAIYMARLKRYVKAEFIEVEIQLSSKKSREEMLQLEAAKILSFLKPGDYLVLLDEKGKRYTSELFAGWLNKKFVSVQGSIVFVIGGPYGFHDAVRARSSELLSLSEMTFTHQMVRVFFAEQLYRALTILKNEPYHHD